MQLDFRGELAVARQSLRESYLEKPHPRSLLQGHAQLIDRIVKAVWAQSGVPHAMALVATGGYGRGELFPHSDIDLLVLLPAEPGAAERASLERLIRTLWDIGLEIGHSVRTVRECVESAAGDVTINTSLRESRYLAGSRRVF